DNERRLHRLSLSAPDPLAILQHPEIRIMFSLDETREPHPATGRLEVIGTSCVFEMPPDSSIAAGRTATFLRSDGCRAPRGRPAGEVVLTVTMGGPGELRVWTIALPPEHRARGLLYLVDHRLTTEQQQPLAVRGLFVDYLPDGGLKRANLLSYLWS